MQSTISPIHAKEAITTHVQRLHETLRRAFCSKNPTRNLQSAHIEEWWTAFPIEDPQKSQIFDTWWKILTSSERTAEDFENNFSTQLELLQSQEDKEALKQIGMLYRIAYALDIKEKAKVLEFKAQQANAFDFYIDLSIEKVNAQNLLNEINTSLTQAIKLFGYKKTSEDKEYINLIEQKIEILQKSTQSLFEKTKSFEQFLLSANERNTLQAIRDNIKEIRCGLKACSDAEELLNELSTIEQDLDFSIIATLEMELRKDEVEIKQRDPNSDSSLVTTSKAPSIRAIWQQAQDLTKTLHEITALKDDAIIKPTSKPVEPEDESKDEGQAFGQEASPSFSNWLTDFIFAGFGTTISGAVTALAFACFITSNPVGWVLGGLLAATTLLLAVATYKIFQKGEAQYSEFTNLFKPAKTMKQATPIEQPLLNPVRNP